MVDIHDYDIQCIEHEILWKYDKSPCDYPDCDCLLSLRKNMINERVLANQEEILPDIIAFNVTIRNQPSYAGKKISRVIREIFCNNKEASA